MKTEKFYIFGVIMLTVAVAMECVGLFYEYHAWLAVATVVALVLGAVSLITAVVRDR